MNLSRTQIKMQRLCEKVINDSLCSGLIRGVTIDSVRKFLDKQTDRERFAEEFNKFLFSIELNETEQKTLNASLHFCSEIEK